MHTVRAFNPQDGISHRWQFPHAEDVIQETLLKAYIHISGFRGNSSFRTWITTIATNNSLMVLRRRKCRAETGFQFTSADGTKIETWEVPCASPNCNRLRERVPILCPESAKCGTPVSGGRRNPYSVCESYGPAAEKLRASAPAIPDGGRPSQLGVCGQEARHITRYGPSACSLRLRCTQQTRSRW